MWVYTWKVCVGIHLEMWEGEGACGCTPGSCGRVRVCVGIHLEMCEGEGVCGCTPGRCVRVCVGVHLEMWEGDGACGCTPGDVGRGGCVTWEVCV